MVDGKNKGIKKMNKSCILLEIRERKENIVSEAERRNKIVRSSWSDIFVKIEKNKKNSDTKLRW